MEAAIDAFYVKVLADDRVKHFFDDVSMDKQRRKQKEFLSAAFGGPLPWTGKDMRKAHEGMGLTEVHFNAIAENLVNTLKDLKISQDLIDQVVAVALTTKDDVLGRAKKANSAIAAMLVFRCIHPPGGATALTAVLGGSAIHDLGFHYVIMPVLVNTLALLLLAVFINFFFPWRRYPAAFNRPASPPSAPSSCTPGEPTHEEVIAALRSLDSFVDVTEEDLLRLLALLRLRPAPDVSTTGSS
jgi:truncated hemoglobin YjbI